MERNVARLDLVRYHEQKGRIFAHGDAHVSMRGQVDAAKLTAAVSVDEHVSQRFYTVAELMRLTGLTRKRVAYWERIGLVTPTSRSPQTPRGKPSIFYSAPQALKALVICELLRLHLSLKQVQQLARNLREFDVELFDSEAYLLTDGYSIYYAFSNGQVVDVHRHHRQMLLLVPLHEQVARLQEVA